MPQSVLGLLGAGGASAGGGATIGTIGATGAGAAGGAAATAAGAALPASLGAVAVPASAIPAGLAAPGTLGISSGALTGGGGISGALGGIGESIGNLFKPTPNTISPTGGMGPNAAGGAAGTPVPASAGPVNIPTGNLPQGMAKPGSMSAFPSTWDKLVSGAGAVGDFVNSDAGQAAQTLMQGGGQAPPAPTPGNIPQRTYGGQQGASPEDQMNALLAKLFGG